MSGELYQLPDVSAERLVDSVVQAFYGFFDNRDGAVGDVEHLLAMFTAGATITKVEHGRPTMWTPLGFAAPRIAILQEGQLARFHEWEIASRTIVAGPIAMRWSAYRKAGEANSGPFAGAGHKFLTLANVSGRW